MKVPDYWPKPQEGKFMIYCQAGWGSGWYLYDHSGKVYTSGGVMMCLDKLHQLLKYGESS